MNSTEIQRRALLQKIAGAALTSTGLSALKASPQQSATVPDGVLPTIRLGDKQVSRLIVGGNPIGGFAYGTQKLRQHMLTYFTPELTAEFLLHCERQGITTFQSHDSATIRTALKMARDRGLQIQWILLTSRLQHAVPKELLNLKPIAICHHGGRTDALFLEGKQEVVRDFVKLVKDAGLTAGVSTHNPQNLARIEDSVWENDFYMTCFYNLDRTPEEVRQFLKEETVDKLHFLVTDPERMTQRMRQVRKPCLGFKILAAGRLCKDSQQVEQAFKFAFENIKPSDGVIVGMYPVFADEVKEDVEFARKYGRG